MKIFTLIDALDYMERLYTRFSRSSKASSEDLEMQQYIIEIIKDRIRDKEQTK